MKKVRRLSSLVFILWGAWLAMLLYLFVQHRLAVMHPHFTPARGSAGTFPLCLSSTYGTYLAWSVSRHDLGFRAYGLHAFGILAAAGLGDL